METKKDSAIGIIPVYRGDAEPLFCLIQDAKGFWGFPKGHQDAGESELETARRELWEESGIQDAEIDDARTFSEQYIVEKKRDKTVRYYPATVARTDNQTPAAFKKEIHDVRWFSFEEALATIRPQSRHLLIDVKQYLEVSMPGGNK